MMEFLLLLGEYLRVYGTESKAGMTGYLRPDVYVYITYTPQT